MTQILIVEKNGTIKESDVKLNDVNELYKKAGFKTAQGFQLQTTFSINKCNFNVSLYAKTTGRAGQENKYDFPPPVDEKLFFGNCVLLGTNSDKVIDLCKEQWNQMYEKLFGGFEDLDNEDSEVSEDEIDDDVSQTKEGYVKDGFIVDDSELELEEADESEDEDVDEEEETEEEEEEEDDTEEEEDDMIKKIKKVKKPIKLAVKIPTKPTVEPPEKKIRNKKANVDSVKVKLTKVDSGNYLNCSDELEEEEYV